MCFVELLTIRISPFVPSPARVMQPDDSGHYSQFVSAGGGGDETLKTFVTVIASRPEMKGGCRQLGQCH